MLTQLRMVTTLLFIIAFSQAQNIWYPLNLGTIQSIYGCYFVDANTGWAVGSLGTIKKTTNGGATWTTQTGTTQNLTAVYFTDANTGWTVSSLGSILKTTNGGTNWIPQTSNTSSGLRSIHFINADTGWVVGDSGVILNTINGGSTWNKQITDSTHFFRSVNFVTGKIGWAIGTVVMKSLDGGLKWKPQALPFNSTLLSANFTDSITGWAVGLYGRIFKTMDGGTNWVAQTSNTSRSLCNVHFTDPNNGWAFGLGGTILKTINGGAIWNSQSVDTFQVFLSSSFPDKNTGYLAGSGIRKTNAMVSEPILTTPANNGVIVSLTPTLTWNKVESAWTYRIQVAADSNFSVLFLDSSALVDTFKVVSPALSLNTQYFWRVNAQNGGAKGAWSTVGKFTTASPVSLIPGNILLPKFRKRDRYLEFSLPKRGRVEAKVLDTQGRTTVLILDEVREAGKYQLEMPKLGSGANLIDLKAGAIHTTVQIVP